jgi:hypothetical protein
MINDSTDAFGYIALCIINTKVLRIDVPHVIGFSCRGGRRLHSVQSMVCCTGGRWYLNNVDFPRNTPNILVALFFLRRSSSPASCFLLPSLHFCCGWRFLPGVSPVTVPLSTLFMTQFFLAIPFRSATFTRRVVFGLKMSLMCRATIARRGIFRSIGDFRAAFARRVFPLRVTTSLVWGPQFSRGEVFVFWRRCCVASFRSLRLFFFGSPTGITSASSAGTSYSSGCASVS